MSQQNRHFLILDGHGSHVTLEAIEQTYEARLNMITLPSHTSHVMQPLDVSYFSPFKCAFRKEKSIFKKEKFAFRKERYESMFKNNHRK
jgi:hypothetical protein